MYTETVTEQNLLFSKKEFCPPTASELELQIFPWSPACQPTLQILFLPSHHNCVSQFLKIIPLSLSLSQYLYIYIIQTFKILCRDIPTWLNNVLCSYLGQLLWQQFEHSDLSELHFVPVPSQGVTCAGQYDWQSHQNHIIWGRAANQQKEQWWCQYLKRGILGSQKQ